jgi:ATP-dependent helicase/nuclease subunit B
LRFILGRAGTGKSTLCLQEISRLQQEDPLGKPLILLVPEQATHHMELTLANQFGLGGTLRAQVLSFRRLAWRILAETGGAQEVQLSEIGQAMILKRLLLQHRLDLRAFAASAEKPGMAAKLAQAIGECKTYRIQPEQLRALQEDHSDLADKLADVALLYQAYNEGLKETFQDSHDVLDALVERLPLAASLEGARIWIDGFKGFTPQEFEVLYQLMRRAEEIHLSLNLNTDALLRDGKTVSFQRRETIFYTQQETYQEIRQLARLAGIPVAAPVILEQPRRYDEEALALLEKNFFSYRRQETLSADEEKGRKPDEVREEQTIRLLAAANRRHEVEIAARELRRLAREKGWRWRDMAVASRQLRHYQEYIEQVFADYQIPCFLDFKRPVMHHPLIEFMLGVLEAAASHWAYEPLFRCLKTDFFPISRDVIDRLENYFLAHGLQARDWLQEKAWDFDEGSEVRETLRQEIDRARLRIRELFQPFIAACPAKEPLSVAVITQALHELLEALQVSHTLTQWAERERSDGRFRESSCQLQIWEAVLQVLDELVRGLGEQLVSLEEYASILTSGLENIALGFIPPGVDQVLIGSLDRSQNPEVKAMIILGASDGEFPARVEVDGLFSPADRERIAQAGVRIAAKGLSDSYDEQYYVYMALTRAREKLMISYPLCQEDGQSIEVSPVIAKLKGWFPWLEEEYGLDQEETLAVVSHIKPLKRIYAAKFNSLERKEETPLWQALQAWMRQDPGARTYDDRLRQAAQRRNQEGNIPRELAQSLYGRRLTTSVSRLERFAACPFAHYAGFGLRLRERKRLEMGRQHMGDFFHAILCRLGTELAAEGGRWEDLERQEIGRRVGDITDQLLQSREYKSFAHTAKARYLTRRLQKTVTYSASVLAELARRGEFMPVGMEIAFGPGEQLSGQQIALEGDRDLVLRGQIDRLDHLQWNQRVYLRIIDYKSSPPVVSLDQVLYGLSVQGLAYLDTVFNGAELWFAGTKEGETALVPAGFIYFPIIDPDIKADRQLREEEIETLRGKALKITGYLLADQQILERMDARIPAAGSEILGIKLNERTGTASGRTKTLTEAEFTLLRQYLHTWLQTTGGRMLAGEIGANPYRYGEKNACAYCAYHPVCHFDTRLPENHFRVLKKLKDRQALTAMRARTGDQEGESQ